MTMSLNRRGLWLVEAILAHVQELRSALHLIEGGGRYIDCGIEARGGLLVGIELARVCLGDLATVAIVPGDVAGRPVPTIQVVTDHPVQACLASQYAGWPISEGKYFAMGSGPMRAVRGREPIYDTIGYRETENSVVGVLETRQPPSTIGRGRGRRGMQTFSPPSSLCSPRRRPASPVACRSWLARSRPPCTSWPSSSSTCDGSSRPTAPRPCRPSPATTLAAIGRTNDAVLYGAPRGAVRHGRR